jgi:twitching motility protein PilT
MAVKPRGLVLATGPTGCGKSTTLAAIIDYVNENFKKHIITIEDPIEFIHRNKKSLVRQRELESDTFSFAGALKHALRQDPDVLMVGEMRDIETIGLALTAAETGHLVLATLHTSGTAAAVDRIIDVFPPHQQSQVRMQLSTSLECVISQVLLPRVDTYGRVMACEILVGSAAVRNLIREGKLHQITSVLQSGSSFGMHTLEMNMRDLVINRVVSKSSAISMSSDPQELIRLIGD